MDEWIHLRFFPLTSNSDVASEADQVRRNRLTRVTALMIRNVCRVVLLQKKRVGDTAKKSPSRATLNTHRHSRTDDTCLVDESGAVVDLAVDGQVEVVLGVVLGQVGEGEGLCLGHGC